MTLWALAALGGAAGAVARYAVDRAAAQWLGATLLGTFAVNISGSFLLGMLVALADGRVGVSAEARALAAVGFLGSYTTFSTLTVASVRLAAEGDWQRAALNLGGSVAVGVAAAVGGIVAGRVLA